jgi:hypothetical protein
MNMHALLLLPILASAPYALIETRDIPAADTKNFKVFIRSVDGKAYWDGPDEMKLTPGVHWLVMVRDRSDSKKTGKKRDEKSLYLMAKPCFKYMVAGRALNDANSPSENFSPEWELHVMGTDRISYCKTNEELEQAKKDKKAAKIKKVSESKLPSVDVSTGTKKADD